MEEEEEMEEDRRRTTILKIGSRFSIDVSDPSGLGKFQRKVEGVDFRLLDGWMSLWIYLYINIYFFFYCRENINQKKLPPEAVVSSQTCNTCSCVSSCSASCDSSWLVVTWQLRLQCSTAMKRHKEWERKERKKRTPTAAAAPPPPPPPPLLFGLDSISFMAWELIGRISFIPPHFHISQLSGNHFPTSATTAAAAAAAAAGKKKQKSQRKSEGNREKSGRNENSDLHNQLHGTHACNDLTDGDAVESFRHRAALPSRHRYPLDTSAATGATTSSAI